jgi:hypothetical protein
MLSNLLRNLRELPNAILHRASELFGFSKWDVEKLATNESDAAGNASFLQEGARACQDLGRGTGNRRHAPVEALRIRFPAIAV